MHKDKNRRNRDRRFIIRKYFIYLMNEILSDYKDLRKKINKVPLSTKDAELIKHFKSALKEEEKILFSLHRSGIGGMRLVHLHTYFIDDILKTIYNLSLRNNDSNFTDYEKGLSITALGGYGRGELNPKSDIDILFVYKKRLKREQETLIKRMLYLFWDIGFN